MLVSGKVTTRDLLDAMSGPSGKTGIIYDRLPADWFQASPIPPLRRE